MNSLTTYGIRKGDRVQVIAGREKGKSGKVLRVDLKSGRIFVEKVNLVKRHTKATQKNPQGGVIEKESSIHNSNILLFCPKCNKGVRHGVQKAERAKKARFCKKCNSSLEVS